MRSDGNKLSASVVVLSGVVLALASLVLILSVRYAIDRFSPSFSNAERHLRRGNLEQAMAIANNVSTESVDRYILRGKIFLANALQQRDHDGWRRYGVDSLDWLQGPAIDSAVACFNRARTMDARSVAASYFLGAAYKEKGWYREAEDALHETVRLDPVHIDARLALASLYATTDKPQQALTHLTDAWEIDPDNPETAKNIAFMYRFHLENPELAIVWFNRYLNCAHPGDIAINRARTELGDLLDRYPEFTPKERQLWRENRRHFSPRHR